MSIRTNILIPEMSIFMLVWDFRWAVGHNKKPNKSIPPLKRDSYDLITYDNHVSALLSI